MAFTSTWLLIMHGENEAQFHVEMTFPNFSKINGLNSSARARRKNTD